MTRRVWLLLPALLLPALPVRALEVVYYDRAAKKEITVRLAEIDDGAEGITIKKGSPTMGVKLNFPVTVSGFDVREVNLEEKDIGDVKWLDYRKPLAPVAIAAQASTKEADRPAKWKEALPHFKELVPKLKAGRVKRQVEYKHGQTLYFLAATDEAYRPEAIKVLGAYAGANKESWQIAPVLDMLAQLHKDQGDLTAMQKAYEELAAIPGVSEEIRTKSLINAARVLIESEKYADAQAKLNAMKLPPDSPLTGEVTLYLAQCEIMGGDTAKAQAAEKKLRDFLTKTQDSRIKALTHNTLGDYYTKNKRDDDAFWEYLRVDTLFSDDKSEHARAMYHLIRLFRDVKKDGDRSQSYEEALKDKKYTGLEYQKKLMKK